MSDSAVTKHFNEKLLGLLSVPDSVKCYSFKYNKGKRDYMRDTLLAVLDNKQIAILQYLLVGNPCSYEVDSIKIEAPYIPVVEYEFLNSKDSLSASVVISTSDKSWCLFCKDKKIFKNTYGDARMVERFCDYFLNMYTLKSEKK